MFLFFGGRRMGGDISLDRSEVVWFVDVGFRGDVIFVSFYEFKRFFGSVFLYLVFKCFEEEF